MAGLKIKKGDRVVVLSGKDKGKEGVVQRALPDERKVVVEGVNTAKRHRKARTATETGGIIEIGLAGGDAPGGELCELRRIAGCGDDPAGRNLVGFEQVVDNALAELAGRAGDENGIAHGLPLGGLKKRVALK